VDHPNRCSSESSVDHPNRCSCESSVDHPNRVPVTRTPIVSKPQKKATVDHRHWKTVRVPFPLQCFPRSTGVDLGNPKNPEEAQQSKELLQGGVENHPLLLRLCPGLTLLDCPGFPMVDKVPCDTVQDAVISALYGGLPVETIMYAIQTHWAAP